MKLNTIMKKQVAFEIKDIVDVYSGKPHCCMCGCSGKYYYASNNFEYGSKNRGYEVLPEEVNDSMVKKVAKIFANWDGKIENINDYIFTINFSESKQYTIYLKDPEVVK